MIDEGHLDIRPIEDHDLFGGRFEPDNVITTLWVEVREARDAGYPGLRHHRLRIVPTYAPAAFTWPAPWTC
jgi:hypothetical protein